MKHHLLLGALLVSPFFTMAHEGHGAFSGHELIHYLTSPLHLIPILVAVSIGVWVWRKRRSTATEKTETHARIIHRSEHH